MSRLGICLPQAEGYANERGTIPSSLRVEGSGGGRTLYNPATGGESTAIVSEATADEAALAVSAAAEAFPAWSRRTAGERARLILRWADLIDTHVEELTGLEVAETGKPAAVFRDGELPFGTDNLRFFAGSARSLEETGAGLLSEGYTSMVIRRPSGRWWVSRRGTSR